jgi:hypothetical protein
LAFRNDAKETNNFTIKAKTTFWGCAVSRYNNSRLANTDFNIICCLVLLQSLMSLGFLLLDIDILAGLQVQWST